MTSRRDKQKQDRSLFYQQTEAEGVAEKQKERKRKILLWKSKLATDLGKLVFAGIIVGGVFEEVHYPYVLFGGGALTVLVAFLAGYSFYKRGIN